VTKSDPSWPFDGRDLGCDQRRRWSGTEFVTRGGCDVARRGDGLRLSSRLSSFHRGRDRRSHTLHGLASLFGRSRSRAHAGQVGKEDDKVAISLKDLKKTTAVLPPRIVIYGPEGIGKTTLAAEFPDPVFLQIEDGTPSDLAIDSFGLLETFDQVMEAISALYSEDHSYQTVVVDGLDKLEPLVWTKVCELNQWRSIESPGYGKGYKEADYVWRDFLTGLNALRRDKEMTIVLLAHSDIDRFDDPQSASYSRYDLRLHDRANAIIKDDMDAIFLVKQDATVTMVDEGFGKKRAQADGGSQRWIYTEGRPAFVAKNRFGMPPKMMFEKGKGFLELSKYFPGRFSADKAA